MTFKQRVERKVWVWVFTLEPGEKFGIRKIKPAIEIHNEDMIRLVLNEMAIAGRWLVKVNKTTWKRLDVDETDQERRYFYGEVTPMSRVPFPTVVPVRTIHVGEAGRALFGNKKDSGVRTPGPGHKRP